MSHTEADPPTAIMTKQPTPPSGSKRISLSGRLPTDPPLLLNCWFQACDERSEHFGDVSRDEAVQEFDRIDFADEMTRRDRCIADGGHPPTVGFGINAPQGACVRLEVESRDGERFTLIAERPVEERFLGFIKRVRTESRTRPGLDALTARAVIKTAFDSVSDLFR